MTRYHNNEENNSAVEMVELLAEVDEEEADAQESEIGSAAGTGLRVVRVVRVEGTTSITPMSVGIGRLELDSIAATRLRV